jgi:hypothetical protein
MDIDSLLNRREIGLSKDILMESIGLVDDITAKFAKGGVTQIWHDMYNQLLEFK